MNYEEILEKLKKRGTAIPELEKIVNESLEIKTKKIFEYLEKRKNRLDEECYWCNKKANKEFTSFIYESPYDENYSEHYFCSENCRDSYEEETSFYCNNCNRFIENSNGHMNHGIEYQTEYICLDCFQKEMFENGLDIDEIEDYKGAKSNLKGSFFSEFELIEHGFEKEENYFISGTVDAKEINKKIIDLYNNDNKISIINYCHLSILGDEGHIELWIKNKK
jgi:hypothetical protein